jgi:hypothetical protein
MSYTAYDFYRDNVKDILKTQISPENSDMDSFIDVIRKVFKFDNRGMDSFKRMLLMAILDPDNDGAQLKDMIRDVFNTISCDNAILQKLVYVDSGDSIEINYSFFNGEATFS